MSVSATRAKRPGSPIESKEEPLGKKERPTPSPPIELDAKADAAIIHAADEAQIYQPFPETQTRAHVSSMEQYRTMYHRSLHDSNSFWREQATALDWFAPFTQVQSGSFDGTADIAWFLNGKLNVSYNCVDRHVAAGRGDKTAILFEGDEPTDIRRMTYRELQTEVCKCANMLRSLGVRKGDAVCIYMPMVPATTVAMLACTRIGAPHSVVFAGFSADALRDRIRDGHCRFVLTADEGRRGGKTIPLKKVVDAALKECPDVKACVVYQHTNASVNMDAGRDVYWSEQMRLQRGVAPCEWMDAEDVLFMLFTSGSTGRPKGIQHTTAGYLLHAMLTCKYYFNLHEDDIHCCAADVGWITGHSYIVYGPLALGVTTFMFESTPLYPDHNRYWQMVQRHKLTTLYTAPTAIRALMRYPTDGVLACDRSSLRVLGSVGEPINPEAWRWYFDVAGGGRVPIVDTYWQTETGGHLLAPFPGATPMKPGSATLPFFGIEPVVLSPEGKVLEGNDVSGVLAIKRPFPGICRSIYGDHERYLHTYMSTYKGFYFTGDGVHRDKDGYLWITGRVDDVVNVSGHRIGSAEVESALVSHLGVAEAAVVGIPHELKGQCLFAFVTPKESHRNNTGADFQKELVHAVRTHVGPFAAPDHILIATGLPKTRSGKIMRRILRKIACQETADGALGDTSTLADPSVVEQLIKDANALLAKRNK